MIKQHTIITGATGAFGHHLAQKLINEGGDITLLVRASSDNDAKIRASSYVTLSSSVDVRSANLQKDNLGLDERTYRRLQDVTTQIIHAAASTRFDLSLDDARKSNVLTTKNLIKFAEGVKSLKKFGYLGTAFVAGRKTGLIPETELNANEGFVNTYDQTKFESETLIRQNFGNFPIAIYRPSLIVSSDSNNYHAAVAVLDLKKNGLLPVIPGLASDTIDLISADEAADAIAKLYLNHFKDRQAYNITSGTRAPSLSRVLSTAGELPTIYSGYLLEDFNQVVTKLSEINPQLSKIYKKIDPFIKYLAYPKQFDNTQTEKILGHRLGEDNAIKILEKLLKQ